MSDFHGRIMNLQPDYAKPDAHAVVYKRGFRDARHVAAEIGLEADALLVRLNEAQSDAGAWEATAQHHYEEARVAEARLAEADDKLLSVAIELGATKARLAEKDETIAGIPQLCRQYEARLAEYKEGVREVMNDHATTLERLADKNQLLAEAVEYGTDYKQARDEAMANYQAALARLAEAEKQIQESHELLLRWHRLYGSQPSSRWECLDDDTTTFVWGGGLDRHAARPADSAPAQETESHE